MNKLKINSPVSIPKKNFSVDFRVLAQEKSCETGVPNSHKMGINMRKIMHESKNRESNWPTPIVNGLVNNLVIFF